MPYHLTKCRICPSLFMLRKINKRWVGYVDNEPVYRWSFNCISCNHDHFVRFYHSSTNKWINILESTKLTLIMNRDVDKYEQALIDQEIATVELGKANDRLIRKLNL